MLPMAGHQTVPDIYSASLKSGGIQVFQGKGHHTQPSALPAQHAGCQQGCSDLHSITEPTSRRIQDRRNSLHTVSLPPSAQHHSQGMKNNLNWIIYIYNHSTRGHPGHHSYRIRRQQLPWQDGLKSTKQLDLRRVDNPMVCLKCYRRHRLNVNQKEKSTDHQHINGLRLAFSAHYCLVWDAGLDLYRYFQVSKL